mmetsp:Transcript_77201/g.154753  ORF Transcript_77201/g.154753 Transcript_77201/m.154753 type:complete len:226 (+) Transcript_77201:196-873(+)
MQNQKRLHEPLVHVVPPHVHGGLGNQVRKQDHIAGPCVLHQRPCPGYEPSPRGGGKHWNPLRKRRAHLGCHDLGTKNLFVALTCQRAGFFRRSNQLRHGCVSRREGNFTGSPNRKNNCHVRPAVQKKLYHGEVAMLRRDDQWGVAVIGPGLVHVRPVIQQSSDEIQLVFTRDDEQQGSAVLVGRVDRGAGLEQGAHLHEVIGSAAPAFVQAVSHVVAVGMFEYVK